MEDDVYATLEDALSVAADSGDALKELARLGPFHWIVAEVMPVPGGFTIKAVTVEPQTAIRPTLNRGVVLDGGHMETFDCPVCKRSGKKEGQWSTSMASGELMIGLDPANCVGCYDTMITRGVAPIVIQTGVANTVARPT